MSHNTLVKHLQYMQKSLFIFCIIMIAAIKIMAQADFYSLYYHAPVAYNPALTGLMHDKWRLNDVFQHRNYNDSIGFNSDVLIFDISKQPTIVKKYRGVEMIEEESRNRIGLGLVANYERYSNSENRYLSGFLSFAYHKRFINQVGISFGIQPGVIRDSNRYIIDGNAGILIGYKKHICWKADQFYKYQIGISVNRIMQSFYTLQDEHLYRTRKINVHFGALYQIKKIIGIIPRILYTYHNDNFFQIGATILYRKHFDYFDRIRLGFHYLNTGFLSLSSGIRLYTNNERTLSLDMFFCYDIKIKSTGIPMHENNYEAGIILTPVKKCWKVDRCYNQLGKK